MVWFKVNGLIGVLVMPMLALGKNHVCAGQTNTEEDVEHGATKTGTEGHDGEAQTGDGDVCHEIAEGVADGENGKAEDRIGHVEDYAESAQDADDLISNCANPGDCDREAEETEDLAPAWGAVRSGGEEDEGEQDETDGQAVHCLAEKGVGVLRLYVCPNNQDNEEGGREYLNNHKPAIPLFRLGGRMRVCGERVLRHLVGRVHNVFFCGNEKLWGSGCGGVLRGVGGVVWV